MGRRGPPKQPAELQSLAGNPGHRKSNRARPKAPNKPPSCPRWLTDEAAKEWRRITPLLAKMNLLSVVDQVTLGAYCQAAAELIKATLILDKEGRLITQLIYARDGEEVGAKTIAHPAVKLQRDAFARLKSFLGEFGLSPSARTNLQIDGESDEVDPLEEIILKLKGAV